MIRRSIKIISIDQLKKGVGRRVLIGLEDPIRAGLKAAKPDLIDSLVRAVSRNQVILGLQGQFAGDEMRDVQAHLGMTDTLSQGAIEEIIQVFRSAVELTNPRYTGKNITLGISLSNMQDQIANISLNRYTSDSSGQVIPWMHWLLKGGQVKAEIDFDLSANEEYKSRSGRALMYGEKTEDDKTFENGTGWNIDDYDRFAKGTNFLIDIVRDKTWLVEAREILINHLKSALKGKRARAPRTDIPF